MDYLTDPDLPTTPRGIPGLSLADQQALAQREQPANFLAEYQQKSQLEAAHVDAIELQRLQAENAQMRDQVGDVSRQLQDTRSGYDNLAGQVSAMQNQASQQAATTAANEQYAYTAEDIDNHGDLLPVIEKATARTRHEMNLAFEQRLAAEKAQWQAEATQPLQQELQATREQLNVQAQRSTADFAARMQSEISQLGLGSIESVMAMPEFGRRFNEPVAPGVATAWGDQLKANIENQNLYAASAMLKDFRDSNTRLRPTIDSEVPAGSTPARPMTSAQSQNLDKREQLTAIYANRQQDANAGVFPRGWDRAKYRAEQEKLKAQIDLIPIN